MFKFQNSVKLALVWGVMIVVWKQIFGGDSEDAIEHLNKVDIPEASKRAGARSLTLFQTLASDADAKKAVAEIQQGNILILDISQGAKAGDFNRLVDLLKDATYKVDGDIARISQDKLIASPRQVKILRKRIVNADSTLQDI